MRVGSDEPPIIVRPRKLDAHRERIAQMLAKFDRNVVKVHRALADAGTSVRYPTLTAFCRKNHLLEGARDPRRSVVAARQWLLELVNGRHSVERLQSQLSTAADLPFLFSQLKHGRSRHRKKAATILARKRGISNSLIAAALRSSRSTTRQYYRMYLEAGPEKLFAWNTTRDMGAEHQFSERTKRILETLHHKPTAFGINRTNWTQPTLLKAYQQSYGETISRSTLARILRRTGYRWRKARRVLTSPDPNYHEKLELLLTAHEPPDGSRCGSVLFFDIGAPKTLQVYPSAIMFCVTLYDRLPAKAIKPFEDGRIPHLQICPNPHRPLRTNKETAAQRCIRNANSNGEQYIRMFQTFKQWLPGAPKI